MFVCSPYIIIRLMNCSNPRSIVVPGLLNRPMVHITGTAFKAVPETMVVPCGKCMACTEKRQKDFAFRIRTEAENRGTLAFVTLTYNNESLPLVQTLWKCDKVTGECTRLSKPEFVCYSRREDYWDYRKDMSMIPEKVKQPRYLDFRLYEDESEFFFTRITPSVCRKDVQNWLKRCRIYFERKHQKHLDFAYAICSEYGEKYCRPHYHCVFMGLTEREAQEFAWLWKFGFTKVGFPPIDDFSAVANYVGKYVSKGEFECQSVKDCTALPCRQMTSKGLGSEELKKLRPYMLCYDMLGQYDVDTFWHETQKRYLTRSEIARLIAEVPKRLVINYDGKNWYAIPRILRNKVFYVEKRMPQEDGTMRTYLRPSKLWKMVVDSLRNINEELDSREFRQLLSNKSPREIAQAVSNFYMVSETFAALADDTRKQNYQTRLQSSVF